METEAYFGPPGSNLQLERREDMPVRLRAQLLRHGDPAAHSFVGITDRNRVMYGPPGYWYVYLIYGMHKCVNVVTGPEDPVEPQAVLLRAGEPVEGLAEMLARRGVARETDVASGPAKLAKALGISRAHYGLDATRPPLRFEEGEPIPSGRVAASPRIGVVGGEALRLRYFDRASPHVSRGPGKGNARASNGPRRSSRP